MNNYTDCCLCPRNCHVDRTQGKTGYCGQTDQIRAARAALHMWEEPCISGDAGSGAVFGLYAWLCVLPESFHCCRQCGENNFRGTVGRNIFRTSGTESLEYQSGDSGAFCTTGGKSTGTGKKQGLTDSGRI